MNSGLTPQFDEKTAAVATIERGSPDNLARWALAFLLIYTIVRNLLAALAKPLWFDELLTVAIARQSSFLATWKAAGTAKDSNPPPFYVVERFFAAIPANEHIAYRLASILGFAAMLAFLFIFVKRRNGERIALICIAPLMLTELLRPYAVEARPYALVAACLAFALICYQHAPKPRWMMLMGLAMVMAECLHYFSIFYLAPFAIAEAAATIRVRWIRWGVWLAIAAGFIPLAIFWPLLSELRHYYGGYVWDPPSLFAAGVTYSLLFKTNAAIALAFVVTLAGVVLFTDAQPKRMTSPEESRADDNERWMAVSFLALPVFLYVAAKVTNGAYTIRYSLPALLGIPVAIGYVCRLLGRRGIALIAACTFIAIALQETFLGRSDVHAALHFESPAASIERVINRAGHLELPVVVSDGQDYFQFIHYAADSSRFVAIVDPAAAVTYTGTNTLDLELPVMRCCMWLQVYNYSEFAGRHPSFLLYSGGGQWDWWAARLANDGDSLQLLAQEKNRRVFLVKLKPAAN